MEIDPSGSILYTKIINLICCVDILIDVVKHYDNSIKWNQLKRIWDEPFSEFHKGNQISNHYSGLRGLCYWIISVSERYRSPNQRKYTTRVNSAFKGCLLVTGKYVAIDLLNISWNYGRLVVESSVKYMHT